MNKKHLKEIKNMKTLLLCGGEGTRLHPLTKKIPKPLVKIKNKTDSPTDTFFNIDKLKKTSLLWPKGALNLSLKIAPTINNE